MNYRKSGILMPVSALPTKYGIGDFGKTAYEFIEIIKDSGFKIWQILPLNPLGYGNSPYQPYSSKALDEIYVSLELLKEENLIENINEIDSNDDFINYDLVRKYKQTYLKQAFLNFSKTEDYYDFISMEWLYNYCVFLTFKKYNNLKCWNEWSLEEKNWIKDKKSNIDKYSNDIEYEMFVQYILYKQWKNLKKYANDNGIEIMGDMPIYVGIDSEDVYSNQNLFLLDKDGYPRFIAGVPPDYFSETGQRWGNPIYNWENIEKDNFKFWIDRLQYNSKLFDILRIDHFRAFDTYWKIPSSCETAIIGEWVEAPGYKVFDEIFRKLPNINIVVEDLGYLREEVLKLRDYYNLKGMKIVQFSFNPDEEVEDNENLIVYTGTHDNESIKDWYNNLDENMKVKVKDYFLKHEYSYGNIGLNFTAMILDSRANIAITSIIDLLNLESPYRINKPGTIGSPNWEFKLNSFDKLKKISKKLKNMNKKYSRI